MSPRQPVPEYQPVRFYKIVAISFLLLTVLLLAVIAFMTTKRAEITIITKEDPAVVDTAVSIGSTQSAVSVAGVVTSTVVQLTKVYEPTGNREEPGVATGVVTLHNESSQAQPLVATTRLLTPDGVLFRLKNYTVVPAKGTVQAEVYADKEGASGNIAPQSRFTIPGLNDTLQQVIYASSNSAMTGGVRKIGVLSDADVEKAKSMLTAELEELGKSELQNKFADMQGVYTVKDTTITTEATVGSELAGFELKGQATVIGVLYDKQAVEDFAERALSSRVIDDAEVAIPSEEEPTVTLEAYDVALGTASLNVAFSGVLTLNPNSKQLERSMFFGKDKDEVRRYLLSLDHVYSVDVKFKPVWVKTIPYVPEHVKVVVKKVE